MDWSATFNWLPSLRPIGTNSGEDDRADMGTAFGLDASFDSFATPADASPPSAMPPWESRLVRRSGL